MRDPNVSSFSLIEVTLALGVVSFALLALFGLLPVGLKENQNSTSQTAATSIATALIADLRATPKANPTSGRFGITFDIPKTLYVDSEGNFSITLTPTARYRATVTFPASPPGAKSATFANIKVTWPAAAAVTNVSGTCEMFAAFDRH
jgi:uncharacterized protein (TIGR02598 family)